MRKTITSLLLAGAAALSVAGARAGEPVHHITEIHDGAQCFVVQFDNQVDEAGHKVFWGVPLSSAALSNPNAFSPTVSLAAVSTLDAAAHAKHMVGFDVPGDILICKKSLGTVYLIQNIDEVFTVE